MTSNLSFIIKYYYMEFYVNDSSVILKDPRSVATKSSVPHVLNFSNNIATLLKFSITVNFLNSKTSSKTCQLIDINIFDSST